MNWYVPGAHVTAGMGMKRPGVRRPGSEQRNQGAAAPRGRTSVTCGWSTHLVPTESEEEAFGMLIFLCKCI